MPWYLALQKFQEVNARSVFAHARPEISSSIYPVKKSVRVSCVVISSIALLLYSISSATPDSPAELPDPSREIPQVVDKLAVLYQMADLGDQEGTEKKELHKKLASYGTRAVPFLNEYLSTPGNPMRKVASLYGLKDILGEFASSYFIVALNDSSPDVRLIAVYLVSPYRTEQTFEALKKILEHDTDRQIRILALAAIGDFGDNKALSILTDALNDRDPDVQRAAKRFLVKIVQDKTKPLP